MPRQKPKMSLQFWDKGRLDSSKQQVALRDELTDITWNHLKSIKSGSQKPVAGLERHFLTEVTLLAIAATVLPIQIGLSPT